MEIEKYSKPNLIYKSLSTESSKLVEGAWLYQNTVKWTSTTKHDGRFDILIQLHGFY